MGCPHQDNHTESASHVHPSIGWCNAYIDQGEQVNDSSSIILMAAIVCCVTSGHDEINVHGVKEHESYRGDRTQASLSDFADNLVPSAGQPHHYIRQALSF